MTLYELTGAWLSVMEMAENEEDLQAVFDTLDSIEASIEDKADGYARVIKNLSGQAKIIKEEEKRLSDRRKTLEASAKRLQERLCSAMVATGKEKIKTDLFGFTIQNNPDFASVEDEDGFKAWAIENAPEYVKCDVSIERTKLRDAIKAGAEIPGVHLDHTRGLRIR